MQNENLSQVEYFLYCRKSTEDKERQVLSLDSQINEMKRLAENLGLSVAKVITESKSAKKPDNRPEFSDMVEVLKNKKDHENYGILCWKIDRLSRNPIDSATIQWLLQTGKLQVIQTMERQYLPSDNVLLFSVESGMANQYILDLSKNVKRGNKTKLEQGGWPGKAPFGYLNDIATKSIVVDKKTAPYIQKVFDLYANENKGLREIERMLFEDGFRTRAGNKIYASTYHRMLMKPFYCGIMVRNGKSYLGKHEPIISKELFDKAGEVMKNRNKPKRRKHYFAFRGIMKCNICECALTGETVTKKIKTTGEIKTYNYYRCTNGKQNCEAHKKYLSENRAIEMTADLFKMFDFDEGDIDLALRAKKEKYKNDESYFLIKRDNIITQIGKNKQKQNKLLDSYLAELISQEVYESKTQELKKDELILENQLKNLKKDDKGFATLELVKNHLKTACLAGKSFAELKESEKEKILNNLLWNCKIENNEIASFTLKSPYSLMKKPPQKGDFHGWSG